MARPHLARIVCSAVVMALTAAGCSSGGGAARAPARQGLASGDAVGQSLFSPAARAVARGERPPSHGAMATVVVQPD